MKIRVPKTNKKTIVNSDAGVVVTILTGVAKYADLKFVGIARCSSDDEFNAEIGSQISYKRAKCKLLNHLKQNTSMDIQIANQYLEDQREKYDTLVDYISELKQEIHEISE